jgi:hypothetical protein
MKVVCINNSRIGVLNNVNVLTVGEYYDVISHDNDSYLVIDDSGYKGWYDVERFIDLCDIREEKLKQLGI